MFKGIAIQLTEAEKEVIRHYDQQALMEMLKTELREELKIQAKLKSRQSKLSVPDIGEETFQMLGLKSLFYGVFKAQENEKSKARQNILRNTLLSRVNLKSIQIFEDEIARLKPDIKPTKEVRDLEKLVKKIKNTTQKKFDFPEVTTMMQFIDQTASLEMTKAKLERAIDTGNEVKKMLMRASKALRTEKSWGSWELFFSKKTEVDDIPPSDIDLAFEEVIELDAYVRLFQFYVKGWFDSSDMTFHAENIGSFVKAFVDNLLVDWMFESRIKASSSKINQILNSVDMLLYGLNTLLARNRNEVALSIAERDAHVARIGEFLEKQKHNN